MHVCVYNSGLWRFVLPKHIPGHVTCTFQLVRPSCCGVGDKFGLGLGLAKCRILFTAAFAELPYYRLGVSEHLGKQVSCVQLFFSCWVVCVGHFIYSCFFFPFHKIFKHFKSFFFKFMFLIEVQ